MKSLLYFLCFFNYQLISVQKVSQLEINQNQPQTKRVDFSGTDNITEYTIDETFNNNISKFQKKTNFAEGKIRGPKKRIKKIELSFKNKEQNNLNYVHSSNNNNFNKTFLYVCVFSILFICIIKFYNN